MVDKLTQKTQILKISLPYDSPIEDYLLNHYPEIIGHRILHKTLDARNAPKGQKPIHFYQVEVTTETGGLTPKEYQFPNLKDKWKEEKPIIIGTGPAGLFCALWLAEHGISSRLFERGDEASRRMLKIARYWRYGELDSESNVCFGEGGAGLYSDGKLITRIKSPLIHFVMKKMVEFGAPPDTEYLSDPHLGSNKIRTIISKISDYLRSKGCELNFRSTVEELLITRGGSQIQGIKLSSGATHFASKVILAAGHSAKEIYHDLVQKKVSMQNKNFAVGVRVEHPRKLIDRIQYGKFSEDLTLGAARYRLSYHDETVDKGTYSFCMCPGGHVLSSSTDPGGLVVNGMSNFARNSPWSNAALVVAVDATKDANVSTLNPLAGLQFIEAIENKAYQFSKEFATGRELPAQTITDFLEDRRSKFLPKTSTPSDIFSMEMNKILPKFVTEHLKTALKDFQNKMPGFISESGLLIAPETRTSAPLRILRDAKTLESPSHQGLYPCGEGAGYAGGITSAAVDGIKVANSILTQFSLE